LKVATPVTSTVDIRDIPLTDLEVWEEANVRRIQITAGIDELAENMKKIGLQQPIVVQPKGNGKYLILIGQRRFLAAKQLEWKSISAIVQPQQDKLKARVYSLSENIHRRDIAARDKATACKSLLDNLGTVKAVAEELGIGEQSVRKWLGYVVVPEKLKKMVDQKKLSPDEAMRISQSVPDEERAVKIATKMVEEGMTKPEKDRVFDAVEDEPGAPVERILKKANEKRIEKIITFVLPTKAAEGLTRAADEEEKPAEVLAKDVVIDWLRNNKYF
jgi:ParB family chromosome partitioning protein